MIKMLFVYIMKSKAPARLYNFISWYLFYPDSPSALTKRYTKAMIFIPKSHSKALLLIYSTVFPSLNSTFKVFGYLSPSNQYSSSVLTTLLCFAIQFSISFRLLYVVLHKGHTYSISGSIKTYLLFAFLNTLLPLYSKRQDACCIFLDFRELLLPYRALRFQV